MAIKKGINILVLMLILVLAISNVSAFFDWWQYSPNLQEITNSQDFNANGRFDLGYNNLSSLNTLSNYAIQTGNSFNQLEVTNRIIGINSYAFMTNGNYLTAYDTNLLDVAELNSGQQVGTLTLLPSGTDIIKIFGIFNDGSYKFKFYRFNTTSKVFTLQNSSNTVSGSPDSIRCLDSGTLYFSYSGVVCLGYSSLSGSQQNLNTYYDNGSVTNLNISDNVVTGLVNYLDVNHDGKLEVLYMSPLNLSLIYLNGTQIFKRTSDAGYFYSSSTFFDPDLTTTMKIAYVQSLISGTSSNIKLGYMRIDGTTFNGVSPFTISSAGTTATRTFTGFFSVGNYNSDGFDEVAIAFSNSSTTFIDIIDRSGNILSQNTISGGFLSRGIQQNGGQIISAKLNNDNYFDFIINDYTGNNSVVYDIQNNQTIARVNGSVFPTEFVLSGKLQLIGYNSTSIFLLAPNFTNSNPNITSLSLFPDSTLQIGTLAITVNANDSENDEIFYSASCGNGNIVTENTSNLLNCNYNSVGIFNLTVYVHDAYHTDFNQFSTFITVINTATCNFNSICESGGGENFLTCPSDCNINNESINPVSNQSQLGSINTLTIPTQLVDTSNPNSNSGLLPEIYFGITNFLSHSLSPLILIVFIIFAVLIMLTIGTIIRKIFIKVTNS